MEGFSGDAAESLCSHEDRRKGSAPRLLQCGYCCPQSNEETSFKQDSSHVVVLMLIVHSVKPNKYNILVSLSFDLAQDTLSFICQIGHPCPMTCACGWSNGTTFCCVTEILNILYIHRNSIVRIKNASICILDHQRFVCS